MSRYRKIPVAELEVGMYVSELDRPWLETPFLFQGFYVQSNEEIAAVRNHCRQVVVDTQRDDDRPQPLASRRLPRPPNEAMRELKDEIKQASGIHVSVAASIEDVMGELKNAGKLNVHKLEAAVLPMVDSVLRNPAAMSCLMRIRRKGGYLYSHSLASSVWATALGREIGLEREALRVVALGAMLLDIGKVRIPEEILGKPGKLDAEELALMRRHVDFSLEIVQEAGEVDPRVLEMVANHHERHDGSGYPRGLKGDEIPVYGRIAGLVDTYDAMITSRPYASTQSSYGALRQLRSLAGSAVPARARRPVHPGDRHVPDRHAGAAQHRRGRRRHGAEPRPAPAPGDHDHPRCREAAARRLPRGGPQPGLRDGRRPGLALDRAGTRARRLRRRPGGVLPQLTP